MVEKAFYKIGFIQVGVTFGGDVVSVDLYWRMKLIIGRIWGLVFAMDHHDSQVCNVCNTRCIIWSFLHCLLFKRMMDSRLWNLQALCAPIVICESCSFFHWTNVFTLWFIGCVCVSALYNSQWFFCQSIGISSSSLFCCCCCWMQHC